MGVFIEPRLSLGDRRSAIPPYFMLRAWNGGLGVLLRVFGPVSADVGVSGGLVKWRGSGRASTSPLTIGNGDISSGNVIARVGLSVALKP